MQHIKEIKDERGKVRIKVDLLTFRPYETYRGETFRYDITVSCIPPGKRNERFGHFDFATPEEILQAKMELWEMLKPSYP